MGEAAQVLAALTEALEREEAVALVTIVDTRGSTYRRAGARLLIRSDGPSVGNLSGGCLESDVERIGREVMRSGRPHLERFDLTAEGEELWGYGLGCNGVIEVLIEPAAHAAETAHALRGALERAEACCLVTVITSATDNVAVGARLLLFDDGRRRGGLGVRAVDEAAERLAHQALASGRGGVHAIEDGAVRVFVEPLLPPPRLVICGAGHDAVPLVRQARALGWRVTVADVRSHLLTDERFPGADFSAARPAALGDAIAFDARTYAVVMTHNYLRDLEYVASLLGRGLAYLGVLGPRRRTQQLLEELAERGIVADDHDRGALHTPAGLDLGAEEPEEVAAAIMAEVLAVSRGRAGGPLRERTGPIHDRQPPM